MEEFKEMEKKLTQQAQRVEFLLDTIRREREKVPASINDAVSIRKRTKSAEEKLIEEIGLDEFEILTKSIENKNG